MTEKIKNNQPNNFKENTKNEYQENLDTKSDKKITDTNKLGEVPISPLPKFKFPKFIIQSTNDDWPDIVPFSRSLASTLNNKLLKYNDDYFTGDGGFTNSIRFKYENNIHHDKAPSKTSYSLDLHHNMYTPYGRHNYYINYNERPYVGRFGLNAGILHEVSHGEEKSHHRMFGISGGYQEHNTTNKIQNTWHKLNGIYTFDDAEKYNLKNTAVASFVYGEEFRKTEYSGKTTFANFGVSLGSYTGAFASIGISFGKIKPNVSFNHNNEDAPISFTPDSYKYQKSGFSARLNLNYTYSSPVMGTKSVSSESTELVTKPLFYSELKKQNVSADFNEFIDSTYPNHFVRDDGTYMRPVSIDNISKNSKNITKPEKFAVQIEVEYAKRIGKSILSFGVSVGNNPLSSSTYIENEKVTSQMYDAFTNLTNDKKEISESNITKYSPPPISVNGSVKLRF